MLKGLQDRMPVLLANKITQASSELAGQRREVTVLLVTLADFAQAVQLLDSEESLPGN